MRRLDRITSHASQAEAAKYTYNFRFVVRCHANAPSTPTTGRAKPSEYAASPGKRKYGVTGRPAKPTLSPVTLTSRGSDASREPDTMIDGVTGADGVTALLGSEYTPQPAPFNARAVNVYSVPLDKPLTVHDNAGTFAKHDFPPGELVTS